MKKNGVIYLIKNLINKKKYIGQTIDFEKRKNRHVWELNNERHDNKYLERSWHKYGQENFKFKIIESDISLELLNIKEKFYINKYNTFDNGYNLTKGGKGKRGFEVSKETKEKMREASKGFTMSEKQKEKISKTKTGTTLSKKTKRKISKSLIGNKRGQKTKAAQKAANNSMYIIKEYHVTNKSYRDLAKELNLSYSTIKRIINLEHFSVRKLKGCG